MAKYRFSIDLGKFFGAKAVVVKGDDGQTDVPGIFIPAAINGLQVTQDGRAEQKRNRSGLRCFANFVFRDPNGIYIQSVRDGLLRKGEAQTPYNIPAYTVCFSLKEEIRTRIRQALQKLVLREQPELSGQADERGTELAKAISRLTPFDMGDAYLVEDRHLQGQSYQNPSQPQGPAVQQAQSWTPPTGDDGGQQESWEDDLPF